MVQIYSIQNLIMNQSSSSMIYCSYLTCRLKLLRKIQFKTVQHLAMLAYILCALPLLCNAIDLPKYPKTYRFKGTWNVPYWNLKQPFYVSRDERNPNHKCQAENTFNGLKRTIHCRGEYKASTQVYTDIQFNETTNESLYTNTERCTKTIYNDPSSAEDLIDYLPTDTSSWTYMGEFVLLGRLTHKWHKDTNKEAGWYYEFYADKATLEPVRYFQHGQSLQHSHPTNYILDFEEFGVTVDDAEFFVPTECPAHNESGSDPRFNKDISVRLQKKTADTWKYGPDDQPYCENITEIEDDIKIPDSFSWRDIPGIVPTVRDQAACGSCWAQAAGEAISAQFNLASDKNVSISVQQIVDCTWDLDSPSANQACDGGEGWTAYHALRQRKIPLTTEETIPYIGISGYCPSSFLNTVGEVIGCKQIKQDPSDHQHTLLKKALIKYGPLMISIRAGLQPFVELPNSDPYYDNQQDCNPYNWDSQKVDHGVLLTGFVQHDGKVYFEIMNSWSTDWGKDGFGYISEENDCGIDSTVLVPTVRLF